MPQLATLVLKDEAATPVDHTFNPRGIDSGVATLVESNGVPIGEGRLSFAQTRNSVGRTRCTIKMSLPVVQDATVNGVTRPTVVRTNYCDIVFNFDNSSSTAERKVIVALIKDMFASSNTMVRKYLVDLEGLY